MKLNLISFILSLSLSGSGILLISCNGRAVKKGTFVATEVPENLMNENSPDDEIRYNLTGSRIASFNPDLLKPARVLTKDFYSACMPSISYDGEYMLFAGQKEKNDPWQIWEMNLNNLKFRKITSIEDDCTFPAYLPDGGLVFTRKIVNDTIKTALCLFTCRRDGSGLHQITFSPSSNLSTIVLRDGRLLTVTRNLIPSPDDPVFIVMRPDGTKADIFYRGEKGTCLPGRPNETADGNIIFAEADISGLSGGDLISITYNRPLHSRVNLTSEVNGEFNFALPFRNDSYLAGWRESDSGNYALYLFDPSEKSPGKLIFTDPGFNITDIVASDEHERQRKLPSEVDMQVKTGLLLCQNINFINPLSPGTGNNTTEATNIEVLGIDTTYGLIPVENDGSFYLKVMADTPFRIRILDEKGNTVNGPCSWLWLRPNERRGCVGCHDDPELVPFNQVPLAVKKAPVIVPVHIKELKEKIVELE